MSRRLVLVTEIIAPYRIPVFNALARREGIELHVIFLAETDSGRRQWLVYKDEICFSYEVLPSFRRRLGKFNFLLNWGMAAALRHVSPDVILCGGYSYLATWSALWWARRHRVPFLLWVESTAKDQRQGHTLVEFLKAKFMHSCDGFVVAGKSSAQYVTAMGAQNERVFTAPDAVDTEFFAQSADMVRRAAASFREALQLPARFFLFVGRLVPEKGVFDLLQAYGLLAPELRSEIGLVFVGEGSARPELEKRAAFISPGLIQFPGFAQREQLASYYALAEAFIFPTHTDPWGLVVNEAMACALPIISTDAAGCAADLVEDGWNGRVVPVHEPAQLASAMEAVARQPGERSLMGERSWQRIQQHSPEACAAGIAEAIGPSGVPCHE